MKSVRINHKNSSNILGVLILLFSLIYLLIFFIKCEIIPIIKLFLDKKNFVEEFSYFSIAIFSIQIVLLYLFVRKLYIGLAYFLSIEECYLEKDNLVYSRYLEIFNFYVLNFGKKEFNILDIKNISLLPYKKSIGFSTNFIPFWYIYFFTYKNRILIETSNEKFEIWNFRRYPNFFNEEKESNKKELENYFSNIKQLVEKEKIKIIERKKYEEWSNLLVDSRYTLVLEEIIEEKILFITKMEEKIIINGYREAIENLEIFKNMEWEEINFYNFYVDYLSKKENKDKIVLVGYNGIDGKEVTMSILKDDINEIRDSKSTFKD